MGQGILGGVGFTNSNSMPLDDPLTEAQDKLNCWPNRDPYNGGNAGLSVTISWPPLYRLYCQQPGLLCHVRTPQTHIHYGFPHGPEPPRPVNLRSLDLQTWFIGPGRVA